MGLLKQNKGYYGKYTQIFTWENHHDVIFLGSSRAEMHYNCRLFDSLTGKNSFNLSMAGASPQVAHALLKVYLEKSSPPKLLFYEVDILSLKNKEAAIFNFPNFFPYLSIPSVRREFASIDARMAHFHMNPFYSLPYSGIENINTSVHGWLNIPTKTERLYYKGYFDENTQPPLDYLPVKQEWHSISERSRNYMDSIVNLCNKKQITIFLISSPIFAGGKLNMFNKKALCESVKSFAKRHSVGYLDFSSLPFCANRNLFIDHEHMNSKGARLYVNYLVNYFNNKTGLSAFIWLN